MKAVQFLSLTGLAMLVLLGTSTLHAQEKEASEVFFIVEEMPVFKKGGLETFRNWVQKQVKYPEKAVKEGITGTVYANFVIDPEGKVGSINIVRSPNQILSDEAIRVLKTSPDWTPGKQRGQKVAVSCVIPIKFALNKDDKVEKKEIKDQR